MLKRLLLAFFLVVAPVGVVGCASLGSQIEQVTPQTPREALAVANVTIIGAIDLAANLHAKGHMTDAEAAALIVAFERVDESLAFAHRLLAAGDEVQAGRVVAGALLALQEISVELARKAQAAGSIQS